MADVFSKDIGLWSIEASSVCVWLGMINDIAISTSERHELSFQCAHLTRFTLEVSTDALETAVVVSFANLITVNDAWDCFYGLCECDKTQPGPRQV